MYLKGLKKQFFFSINWAQFYKESFVIERLKEHGETFQLTFVIVFSLFKGELK